MDKLQEKGNWKGENAGYVAKHTWIVKHYGNAKKCENKKCVYPRVNSKNVYIEAPKRFEWALIKGKKYTRNVKDYIQLCPSCHRKYDYTEEYREKQRQRMLGTKMSEETKQKQSEVKKGKRLKWLEKGVIAINIKTKKRTIFPTMRIASEKLNMTRGVIYYSKHKGTITNNGYRFEHVK